MAKFGADDIKGIVVPLVTPFKGPGIDERGLQNLLRHVVGKEKRHYVDAVFINGLTGEFPWLDTAQKKDMLGITHDECGGKVPIVFGATCETSEETIDMCRYGEDNGADALVIAPLYFCRSNKELPRAVGRIARCVRAPIFLYNNPAFSGIGPRKGAKNIETRMLRRLLLENQNVYGIKDSSGDLDRLRDYSKAASRKRGARVFLGDETLMFFWPDSVPSFANMDPERCRMLYDNLYNDNYHSAEHVAECINEIGRVVYCEGKKTRGGLKYALSIIGVCSDIVAEPFQTLSQLEKDSIRRFVSKFYI